MSTRCDGSLLRGRTTLPGSCRTRAAGPLQAGHTSPASGLAAADHRVRRFRFVIADSPRRDTSEKRRIAVAEYVAGWPGAEIVGESRHGNETVVLVTLRRAVPMEVVEEFVRGCPHYVADTFAWLAG